MYRIKRLLKFTGRIQLALFLVLGLMFGPVQAEDANENIVLTLGDSWGSYAPANYYEGWNSFTFNNDLSNRSYWDPESNIFYTTRYVSSGQFGNPGFGWLEGYYIADFTNHMAAIEYNPTEEFAEVNADIWGPENAHYAQLAYNKDIPGAGDPERDYHIPAEGGQVMNEARTHAYGVSAWPTQLGVDVKLTVHNWSTPYGHMDDFHLVEVELHNTGEADIDGDGTVDISNNKIHSLVLNYNSVVFGFRIHQGGGRSYWKPNSRFRGYGLDLTPDQNGNPWNIGFQGFGSDHNAWGYPGFAQNTMNYADNYVGYTYLGAKKYDEQSGQWVEKHLAFTDENGNHVVPAVGEGERRGWFMTHQPGYNSVNDGTPKGAHISAMGAFYEDGGKSIDKSAFNLRPNDNIFASGDSANPTTFTVKDPSQWTEPDGAFERVQSQDVVGPEGTNYGQNPLASRAITQGGRLEPGVIKEGFISEYWFDGEPVSGFGPVSLEVGERVKIYFVRGMGFRMDTGPNDPSEWQDRTVGLRKTMKAARAVYENIDPNSPEDGVTQFNVPEGPPVPNIKVEATPEVVPIVKFEDPATLGSFDGVKIYRSSAWPRYNPLEKGTPTQDVWWHTMDPENQPEPVPYNPLVTQEQIDKRVQKVQGRHWGPYELVKTITKDELSNYTNTGEDADQFRYAWVDETYTAPGQSYWYYVATYKENPSMPAEFEDLEPDNVNWIESGKTNFNGRTGEWEGTWAHSENHAFFPDQTNVERRKDIGARFVLVPPTSDEADLKMDQVDIGVRPNPYKRTAFHDTGSEHNILFYNLPQECTISIFDLSGMLIDRIDFTAPTEENGSYFWNMYSKNGNEVASGLYIYVVEHDRGKEMGKFAIIR